MRILMFGANGQVGRDVQDLARERSLSLVALDRAAVDITDPAGLDRAFATLPADVVINAAAYTAVDRAEAEPELAERANMLAPGLIAERCERLGLPLLHLSTDYVFDGTKTGAYIESDPIRPLGVYGRTKAAGEAAIRAATSRHVILRTSWVYGVHGANFLKTMLRLARERDQLSVVADQRGCPTATRDISEALIRVAEAAMVDTTCWGTFHFAGTGATTWHGFASHIIARAARHTARWPEVVAIPTADYPTPARRPANSELDCGLFERTFHMRAAPWQSRTDEVVDHLLA